MNIKKTIRYLLMVAVIVFATLIIILIFFSRHIFTTIRNNRETGLSSPLISLLNFFDQKPAAPKNSLRPEYTIQIIEGWTNHDINQYFNRLGKWPETDFYSTVGKMSDDECYDKTKKSKMTPDWSARFTFLKDKPDCASLEGYLFPDTYRLFASSSAEEAVEKMLQNFDNKLTPELRAEIKAQGKTIFSVLTMASIIEKEAPINYNEKDNDEARIISGIFWHRLKIGQRLESDATLSYLLKDNQPQHSGQELEVDSPYNTYRYKNLPPGPICNPGLVAIKAAIYPISTNYNYFLTTLTTGKVFYARTYEEHLNNKYQYLR